MRAHVRGLWAGLLLVLLSAFHMGCEYVRPTLNAPLETWKPDAGYRFTNVAPPEADNTDSLLFVAAFQAAEPARQPSPLERFVSSRTSRLFGKANRSGCSMSST